MMVCFHCETEYTVWCVFIVSQYTLCGAFIMFFGIFNYTLNNYKTAHVKN